MKTDHRFLHGFRQRMLHARVALHVAGRAFLDVLTLRMAPWRLPVYLRRASLFLRTLRHGKVAVRNGRYKLHLYFPAYPTPAFWHSLEKLRRPDPGPVTVVLSMTRACGYKCPHCYQAKDRGKDLPMEMLVATAREMQDAGVSLFDIEGGEPLLLADRMIQLTEALDERAEVWMNTTGAKLTAEKADGLMAAGLAGVMVSVHSPDPATHDAFTRVPGSFDVACNALAEFGRVLFGAGKVTRGMEYLNEAGRIDPYSVRVLWNLAMTHSMMLQPEKSAEYSRRIGEIEPDNPMRYYGQAMAHGLSGNNAQAILMDIQAIELDPNDHELVAGMAIRWTILGDLEQAELWAKKADEMAADKPISILARVGLYQYREQYNLAADLAKRALDRELDNRQQSNNSFRRAWIGSLVQANRIDEALDYYRKALPEAFETPPALDLDSNRHIGQLVEVATLLQMQDPNSPLAVILIDAAEQKNELNEDRWLPWLTSVQRAAIAVARGDKATAIAFLNEVPDGKFGGRWRDYLGTWWVWDALHDEPEFKHLIAMLEEDMDRQREEAYELLGMNK